MLDHTLLEQGRRKKYGDNRLASAVNISEQEASAANYLFLWTPVQERTSFCHNMRISCIGMRIEVQKES